MEFGKIQTLKVIRKKEFGFYLSDPDDAEGKKAVLIPLKQAPEGASEGDSIEVFLYKDSSDRPIATTRKPLLTAGETGKLTVKDVTKIGAFLDIGLERDVLLPFRETEGEVKINDKVLVALFVDKSERLAATMRVYHYLKTGAPYEKDADITGTVYEVKDLGVFVAVDDRYFGLIPKSEAYGEYKVGQEISARVLRVREDGKLDLSPRKKAYMQMDDDADTIFKSIEAHGGKIDFTDKSDPEKIRKEFGMSKNEFKRAVGRLLKEGKIILTDSAIEQKKN
jgi:predicted RNA-binding protein (virulence factor B family)